jgi:hypothetical protein
MPTCNTCPPQDPYLRVLAWDCQSQDLARPCCLAVPDVNSRGRPRLRFSAAQGVPRYVCEVQAVQEKEVNVVDMADERSLLIFTIPSEY